MKRQLSSLRGLEVFNLNKINGVEGVVHTLVDLSANEQLETYMAGVIFL